MPEQEPGDVRKPEAGDAAKWLLLALGVDWYERLAILRRQALLSLTMISVLNAFILAALALAALWFQNATIIPHIPDWLSETLFRWLGITGYRMVDVAELLRVPTLFALLWYVSYLLIRRLIMARAANLARRVVRQLLFSDMPLICADDMLREQIILELPALRGWRVQKTESLERRIRFLALNHKLLWSRYPRHSDEYWAYRERVPQYFDPGDSDWLTAVIAILLLFISGFIFGFYITALLLLFLVLIVPQQWVFRRQAAIAAVCEFFLEGDSSRLLSGWYVPVG